MKYILLLFLCISFSAKAQWKRVPTLGAGSSGLMLDEQNYVVMGDGQAYYSEDAGKNWKEAFMSESNLFYLSDIQRISPTMAVARTWDYNNSRLLKTSDAGKNWHYLRYFPHRKILDLQFVSADTGYLALSNPFRFLKTIDGGLHWDSLPLPVNPTTQATHIANVQFRFWNGQLGYLGVSPGNQTTSLFKTTNGGQTWLSTSTFAGTQIGKISSIQLLDAERVLYCFWSMATADHAKWYFSANGGLSTTFVLESFNAPFEFRMAPLFKSAPGHFHFKTYSSSYNGDYSGLSDREGFQTTDNGTTWSRKPGFWGYNMNTEPNPDPTASYHLEVGYGGRVFKADQASSYRIRMNDGYFGSLGINPSGELYSVSKYGVQYLDSAFRYKDFQSFTHNSYEPDLYSFPGFGGSIPLGKRSFITHYFSNLGSSWAAYTINIPDSLGNIGPQILFWTPLRYRFTADSNLVAVGTDTSFRLYTLNNFKSVRRSIPAGISSLSQPIYVPVSPSEYFLANQSRIYKTSDSAQTWQETAYDTVNGLIQQLHFQNDSLGFSFGRHICRTSDGGQTWARVDTTTYSNSNWKIHFISSSKGFAYGSKLLKTTDSGLTWSAVPIPVLPNNSSTGMAFSPIGEGILQTHLDSLYWYYDPASDVWTSELKPKGVGVGVPVFDFVHNRWLGLYSINSRTGVLVRTGGPVVAKANLQLVQDQLCPGDSIEVNFLFSDLQIQTPVQVQLSDGQGSFANPMLLGNLSVARSLSESAFKRRFAMPAGLSLGGTYHIRVSGNVSFQSSTGQQFTLRPVPLVQVAASDTLCRYSTQSLPGSPAGGLWISPALYYNGSLKASTEAGTYPAVYKVSVSGTCSGADTLQLTVLASPPPATISLLGNNLRSNLTTGFTFRWMKDGTPVGLPGDTSLVLSGPGAYWLEAWNAIGCSSLSNVVLITDVLLPQKNTSVRIFPNPVSGSFTVECPFPAKAVLFNEMGRKLAEYDLVSGQDLSIRTHDFPAGVYFLKVVSSSQSEVHKVLIMAD